jgi:excisionase family DNA binding protein
MSTEEKGIAGLERSVEAEISGGRESVGEVGWSRSEFFENQVKREWLSTKEVASYLALSENAVRILVHRGRIPTFRFGRRLRFRLIDCQRLFERKGE